MTWSVGRGRNRLLRYEWLPLAFLCVPFARFLLAALDAEADERDDGSDRDYDDRYHGSASVLASEHCPSSFYQGLRLVMTNALPFHEIIVFAYVHPGPPLARA